MKELESLRSLDWDREDHKRQMEAQLMWTQQNQSLMRPRFRFVAAALLLLCGALFGAVSTTFVYEYRGQTITTTEFDDGSSRVTIEKDGETVFDRVLEPGVMLFQVEEDGEEDGSSPGPLLEVTPADSEAEDDDA